jgi:hypothetical protein
MDTYFEIQTETKGTNLETERKGMKRGTRGTRSLTQHEPARPFDGVHTRYKQTGDRLAPPRFVQLHQKPGKAYTLVKRIQSSRLSARAETGHSESERHRNHHAVTAEHVCTQCPANPSRRSRHARCREPARPHHVCRVDVGALVDEQLRSNLVPVC